MRSRVKGSYHIFAHPQVRELVNLQEVKGEAKPYQIRQFLELVWTPSGSADFMLHLLSSGSALECVQGHVKVPRSASAEL